MIKSPVWNDIETLWHEMDKAFTGLRFTSPVVGLVDHAFGSYPSIRLHEGPEALYVEAMVPGADPGTLNLSVVRRTLTLAGEKRPLHTDTEAEPKVFHRKERSEGRFERRFTLPMEVDTDKVSAEYADGMLSLYVEAMVPGADPGTLNLSVVRRTLTLAGEKRPLHTDTEAEPKVFHRKERSEGRFERRFTLPMEVDTDKVSAEYADGMLRVTLPKLGQDTPRQISIQTA